MNIDITQWTLGGIFYLLAVIALVLILRLKVPKKSSRK